MADLLRMDYINGLPQPFLAHLIGDGRKWPWPVFDIAVDVPLIRIDVCGKLQVVPFSEVAAFIDADGTEHDPDTFWVDAQQVPA